jgi:hypothetical protein
LPVTTRPGGLWPKGLLKYVLIALLAVAGIVILYTLAGIAERAFSKLSGPFQLAVLAASIAALVRKRVGVEWFPPLPFFFGRSACHGHLQCYFAAAKGRGGWRLAVWRFGEVDRRFLTRCGSLCLRECSFPLRGPLGGWCES